MIVSNLPCSIHAFEARGIRVFAPRGLFFAQTWSLKLWPLDQASWNQTGQCLVWASLTCPEGCQWAQAWMEDCLEMAV